MSSVTTGLISPTEATPRPPKRRLKPQLSIGVDGLRNLASRNITIDTDPSPVVGKENAAGKRTGLGTHVHTRMDSVSSELNSPTGETLSIGSDSDASDDLSKNLEKLEKLRKNVQKNLKLRPLRSNVDLRAAAAANANGDRARLQRSESPETTLTDDSAMPSPALSVYYTPTADFGETPLSARFVGMDTNSNSTPNALSRRRPSPNPALDPPSAGPTRPEFADPSSSTSNIHIRSPEPMVADTLIARLSKSSRPLVIDGRPPSSYRESRIPHSINIALPSLILRRAQKPGAGLPSLDSLRTYISTDDGKRRFDILMGCVPTDVSDLGRGTASSASTSASGSTWDGDIVVYDDDMLEDDRTREKPQSLAWSLIHHVLQPLIDGTRPIYFLKGGMNSVPHHLWERDDAPLAGNGQHTHSDLRSTGDGSSSGSTSVRKKSGGLFQLDTQSAARSKAMPEVELPTSSPKPVHPSSNYNGMLCDYTPSPSPSSSVFPHHAKPRKTSIPNLRRIDTSSAERLVPKLTLRTVPVKSNTLAAPPSAVNRKSSSSSLRSNSPSHLNLSFSNKNGASSSRSPPGGSSPSDALSPSACHLDLPPPTPMTPFGSSGPSSSPATARPDFDQPPSTEEPLPSFTVSSILPNFLYLGPEPSTEEHVEELLSLGVKRVLNIAIECDDDQGLRLRERFDRYTRIPMRDIVEEENVARSVREACEALDDARLHSAPTYVHCKAGKSRSVTAVIAYLIHANHWTLSRAYAFVTERRKGISPNIGFVSELMTFEEQELGVKSNGVVSSAGAGPGADSSEDPSHRNPHTHGGMGMGGFGYNPSVRRVANHQLRESLPPLLASHQHQYSDYAVSGGGQLMSAGGVGASVGNSGQEVEVKDASGRYRHARRAPVDETTLQPMRRVSKAGLESASWSNFADL